MTAPRRKPLRATLSPATARLLVMYLENDKGSFTGWMKRAREHLPLEDQLAVEDDLADLGLVANWYRDWVGSYVGHGIPSPSDTPPSLPHEFTTREAADVLNVSQKTVRRLVQEGALVGRAASARHTLVTRASVLTYRAVSS